MNKLSCYISNLFQHVTQLTLEVNYCIHPPFTGCLKNHFPKENLSFGMPLLRLARAIADMTECLGSNFCVSSYNIKCLSPQQMFAEIVTYLCPSSGMPRICLLGICLLTSHASHSSLTTIVFLKVVHRDIIYRGPRLKGLTSRGHLFFFPPIKHHSGLTDWWVQALLPSLATGIQSSELTWWKERIDFPQLFASCGLCESTRLHKINKYKNI